MLDWLGNPDIWIALVTLTALEIVLGIDNIIFLSILAAKLPAAQQGTARRVGLLLAMGMRVALLFSLSWIMQLTAPLFTVLGQAISGRDLILIGGGLFLLGKSTFEIHDKLEGGGHADGEGAATATFASVIAQIVLLDIVFSLDSVITAVGMVDELGVMVAAVVIAVGVMMLAAGPIGDFVNQHPTIKILALSFLILIGFTLVVEGFDLHIPKGYIYVAMGFAVAVEFVNLRLRPATVPPVQLRQSYVSVDTPVGVAHPAPAPGRAGPTGDGYELTATIAAPTRRAHPVPYPGGSVPTSGDRPPLGDSPARTPPEHAG